MTPQLSLIDASRQTTPIRWDRVRDAREKLERGDYDLLTDAELGDAMISVLHDRSRAAVEA